MNTISTNWPGTQVSILADAVGRSLWPALCSTRSLTQAADELFGAYLMAAEDSDDQSLLGWLREAADALSLELRDKRSFMTTPFYG